MHIHTSSSSLKGVEPLPPAILKPRPVPSCLFTCITNCMLFLSSSYSKFSGTNCDAGYWNKQTTF